MDGNVKEIFDTLKDQRININEVVIYGRCPLILAYNVGMLEVVELLLQIPTTDTNVRDKLDKRSTLHYLSLKTLLNIISVTQKD